MRAIIFAAGLGTRIQEISKGKPKALVELEGETLLERAIEYLSNNGIDEVIVNIHHQAEMMKAFITSKTFPIPVTISDESDLLLDTGGGLLNARPFLEKDDFVVFNVDVLTNLNLKAMLEKHRASQSIATLAVRKRSTSRYLLFNNKNKMIGWENTSTKEQILHSSQEYQRLAFSGIHILSPKIFDLLEQINEKVFSITKAYIELSKEHNIYGFIHDEDYWFDVGKPDSYLQASNFIK
jgi:NDP-sugar pyrophosphorylase family protein